MKIDFKYNLQRIYNLRDKSRLFASSKYLGSNFDLPKIITDIETIRDSGLELTRLEMKTLKMEALRLKRLSSPYGKVQERELARIATEDFLTQMRRVEGLTQIERKNIAKIIKTVENFNQQQKEAFYKSYYQDPRTVTARTAKPGATSPTPEQKMRKAYGRNGYILQRVLNARDLI